jgi:hypothetical protein
MLQLSADVAGYDEIEVPVITQPGRTIATPRRASTLRNSGRRQCEALLRDRAAGA